MMELCEDERPREKMITRGKGALTNAELMAILLRTGMGGRNVLDVARDVLKGADGRLGAVAELSLEELCKVPGVGPGKAVSITAAFELGRRLAQEEGIADAPRMDSPAKVYRVMIPHMRNLTHEECWVLFLNRANRLIAKEMMTSGGQDSTVIDKRMVLRRTLERKASAVILVHNHPSGDPTPSVEDIRQTRDLSKSLLACDLHLVDHVIVSGKSYYSFSDERLVTSGR